MEVLDLMIEIERYVATRGIDTDTTTVNDLLKIMTREDTF